MRELLKPSAWANLPTLIGAVREAAEIDIPAWQWPRLGLAFLRAGSNGIEWRVIDHEMVTPFTTSGGAQVLRPNWAAIKPVLDEFFR